jgi:hypothetical protein
MGHKKQVIENQEKIIQDLEDIKAALKIEDKLEMKSQPPPPDQNPPPNDGD